MRFLEKLFLSVIFSLVISLFFASASVFEEKIKNFDVDVVINKDASINVEEKILYDFGDNERHGIFRSIPTVYGGTENGDKVFINFRDFKVTDENGNAYNYGVSGFDTYRDFKIGDANKTISGQHWYYISYKVDGIINGFDSYDELYWNVTGNDWSVSIENASVTFSLAEEISKNRGDLMNATCYTGVFGSKSQECSFKKLDGPKYVIKTNDVLYSDYGFTGVVSIKKGLIDLPSEVYVKGDPSELQENVSLYVDGQDTFNHLPLKIRLNKDKHEILADSFKYGSDVYSASFSGGQKQTVILELKPKIFAIIIDTYLPIFLFIVGMISILFLWWKKGRDPRGNGVIMPIYEAPENLTPGEVGAIYDDVAHMHDITATIINLAVKGYLKIEQLGSTGFWWFKKSDYKFVRLKDNGGLDDFEKKVFDSVFTGGKQAVKEVKMSKLANSFYKQLPTIKEKLFNSLIDKGYFKESPDKVRENY
ncbi:DUF2207 domain-containing protein, partial [Candidatus Peregrinibacteria bacterium]|nr:DUF2207 domain-containing protein [Candidatus Peregrinibacteria bacterium]